MDKETIIPQRAPQKREAPVPSPEVLDVFDSRRRPQFDQGTGFHGGPSARRKGYRLAMWSWVATIIDVLILISASCAFILMFSVIVKTSPGAILRGVGQNQPQILFFIEVGLLFGWIYMISVRSFMGSTFGEWACDLRLGQPHERLQVGGYLIKVAFRTTLILLTGVITLPLLSLVFGKDFAGSLSGLRLFSLK